MMRDIFGKSDQAILRKKSIEKHTKVLIRVLSILAFSFLIVNFGFEVAPQYIPHARVAYAIFIILLAFAIGFHLIIKTSAYIWIRWFTEVLFFLMLLVGGSIKLRLLDLGFERTIVNIQLKDFFINLLVTAIFFIEISKWSLSVSKLKINPPQAFILSFVFAILIGTGLLSMPNATYNGISFVDALFTSTSAVCVTGLIVLDTASDFTLIGQIIIMILFQVGGLGMMTFASFFGFFFKSSYSLQSQLFIQDYINEEKIGAIYYTLVRIIFFTLLVEAVAGILIYSLIEPELFASKGDQVFFSMFHAISAFCNAGFSTLSDGLYQEGFRTAYHVHLTIAFAIILGGIGFPVVMSYYSYLRHVVIGTKKMITGEEQYRHAPRVVNVSTKLIVNTTIILLVLGFVSFWFSERDATLAGLSGYGKVVTAFFGSVTPRTAGFNTVDMTALTLPTILICLILMWIGASPGSTGGGLKTSTFAVAVLNAFSIAKGKRRVEIYNRVLTNVTVRKAFAVILLSFLVIGLGVFLVSLLNPELELIYVAFEVFSAFSTVGLSLGITGELSSGSKLVVIAIMFMGRVGTLTLMMALVTAKKHQRYKYPEESVYIT
ncbi:TrkH family potassium uptake protein [Negadavirga shengliensis]|uniref:TrkH family potassium uptake protein n=1 Tax=Negadavirga shengliensis TaxID=1389218 RepID=A0ABV9SZU7_9BACT